MLQRITVSRGRFLQATAASSLALVRSFLVVPLLAVLALAFTAPVALAAPCLIVTITGSQGGPAVFNGLAGPGTLVQYGDDASNCNAVRLQTPATIPSSHRVHPPPPIRWRTWRRVQTSSCIQ